jgi:photosystem II stability/assembly factor-like uncharacterized protein
MNVQRKKKISIRWLLGLSLAICALLLAACSGGGGGNGNNANASTTPTEAPVNGFGIASNHVHSLLALPGNVLVLATHLGLFRSTDGGNAWTMVAGGSGQTMAGLMTESLGVSPLNGQRLYVLTLPAVYPWNTVGLYTSADGGQTWKLAVASASLTPEEIYLEEPGNDSANEVYIYIPDRGAQGLLVSMDDGQHFSNTGNLPFGNILGLLAIPGEPGHLLAYGDNGVARSIDGGKHWQVIQGIVGGVTDMTTTGPHSPIYASGDAGVMVSKDDGETFPVVNQASYAGLVVSPTQSQVVYGKTGLAVYRSSDGGHTWSALPHINGNLAEMAVDPSNPSLLYLSLSYPTEVYDFQPSDTAWQSLTPKA